MYTIVLITDAWYPQINGVVTTYNKIIEHSKDKFVVVHPELFKNFEAPFYKEIKLSLCSYDNMRHKILDLLSSNTLFHIATEGPLGIQAKRVLDDYGIPYTTAYHTKFPEFFKDLIGLPTIFTRWYFDWFHKKSKKVLVPSASTAKELPNWDTAVLGRGSPFTPTTKKNKPYIVLLSVGRVSKEKGLDDFCKLDIQLNKPVKKIVVGDGPYKTALEKKYPDVTFTGYKFGEELRQIYSDADVLVFTSKNDTFGIVILESMSCGTPVAAYPVTGPIDQIHHGINGWTHPNLYYSVSKCLTIDRNKVYESVKHKTWDRVAEEFTCLIANK